MTITIAIRWRFWY